MAVPIYYATGNRWKAFGYATMSGMAEPLGAVLGWAALEARDSLPLLRHSLLIQRRQQGSPNPATFGCVFGVVAGMMCYITLVGVWQYNLF